MRRVHSIKFPCTLISGLFDSKFMMKAVVISTHEGCVNNNAVMICLLFYGPFTHRYMVYKRLINYHSPSYGVYNVVGE